MPLYSKSGGNTRNAPENRRGEDAAEESPAARCVLEMLAVTIRQPGQFARLLGDSFPARGSAVVLIPSDDGMYFLTAV